MKRDIEARLEGLREHITTARSMPMSASAVINRAEVLELIDELERAVDDTLSHATEVVGDRDAVVASGRSEADTLIEEARQRQEQMVSDSHVFGVAQARADEIIVTARREAEELRREIDAYVEEHLANFEHTLDKTLTTVRRGRARLTSGHSSGLADDSDVADMDLPEHLRRGER